MLSPSRCGPHAAPLQPPLCLGFLTPQSPHLGNGPWEQRPRGSFPSPAVAKCPVASVLDTTAQGQGQFPGRPHPPFPGLSPGQNPSLIPPAQPAPPQGHWKPSTAPAPPGI